MSRTIFLTKYVRVFSLVLVLSFFISAFLIGYSIKLENTNDLENFCNLIKGTTVKLNPLVLVSSILLRCLPVIGTFFSLLDFQTIGIGVKSCSLLNNIEYVDYVKILSASALTMVLISLPTVDGILLTITAIERFRKKLEVEVKEFLSILTKYYAKNYALDLLIVICVVIFITYISGIT